MLDQVNALVKSLPKTKTRPIARRVLPGLQRGRLRFGVAVRLDIANLRATPTASSIAPEPSPKTLGRCWIRKRRPTDSIRTWARSLAGISDVLANDDSQVRTLLQNGPGAANEASRLFEQIKPTLPVLLANLTTIGQIGVTYHPSLEQLLVLLPSAVAYRANGGTRTIPTVWPEATSHSRSTIRLFARSASCRQTNGDPRPTPATSTRRTGCTANCRRIHRSRFAAPATIRAWVTPESARPPSKSATATSRSCRWRCASMCSAPPPWIRTCSPRAYRPTTGSPPTRESSARSREHRCRRGRSRAEHRRGRGEQLHHRARWAPPHRRRRRRRPTCRHRRGIFRR